MRYIVYIKSLVLTPGAFRQPLIPSTGSSVLFLVIPKSLIRNNHSDVLRRNYTKTEIPEDGISGRLRASESKLIRDLTYTI